MPRASHLIVSLNLCSCDIKVRGQVKAFEGQRVSSESLSKVWDQDKLSRWKNPKRTNSSQSWVAIVFRPIWDFLGKSKYILMHEWSELQLENLKAAPITFRILTIKGGDSNLLAAHTKVKGLYIPLSMKFLSLIWCEISAARLWNRCKNIFGSFFFFWRPSV